MGIDDGLKAKLVEFDLDIRRKEKTDEEKKNITVAARS